MHEFSAAVRRLLDFSTVAFAAVAAVSLEQVATIVTIGAGAMSIICGAIRVYEWLKARPRRAG
jgi:hypothetical protein